MQLEAGLTFIALASLTLWFNRWVVREELKSYKAEAEKEILGARVKLVEEMYDLALVRADAAEEKLERMEEDNKVDIQRRALPFHIRNDRDDAKLEREMTQEQAYFDEVPGLGR